MVEEGTYQPDGLGPDPGEDEEEDWFGEGSAFDSGEDLAAALFSMAGVTAQPASFSGAGDDDDDAFDPEDEPLQFQRPNAPAPSSAPVTTIGLDAFQVVERTSSKAPGEAAPTWGVRSVSSRSGGAAGSSGTSWSMRHSVQFLKMTEEVIKKLRNEAVELTWQVAAVGIQQATPPKPLKPGRA